MIIMSSIAVKKTWFARSVEGTGKVGEDACTIRAKTRVFSGLWKYDVAVDSPGETLRTSGHFLQVLHDMKNNPVAAPWLGLLRDVSQTVCDRFGSATTFFSEEQMLIIAALKNGDMSIAGLSGLLSMDRGKVLESLNRLKSLDLVARDDFSDAEVAKKTYRLESIGHLIHGLLVEDRKFCAMQSKVDRLMG
jgi:hypothetical protein